MRKHPGRGRRAWTALLASGVAAGAAGVGGAVPASAAPPPAPGPKPLVAPAAVKDAPSAELGAHDAGLLAKAQARHQRTVTLIVAADTARTAAVAGRLRGLGATISRRVDKVGYVLAQVPTGKVLSAAKLPGVTAVDLDERIMLPKPDVTRPGPVRAARQAAPAAAPGAGTPAANPYMPTQETGSVDFKQANPAWDGRGVTIGVMDSGVDLDHPALKTTSDGKRKIVDWVTATDPVTEGDGTWRRMTTEVTGPTFTYADITWTAPAGTWKVNRFSESITAGSEAEGDVNRDGDTTDSWGVLYDPQSHDVRVDVNNNHDFTDDAVMRPYKEKFDVGHFGTDNPATPKAETMPFVVEYREDVDLTPAGQPGVVADYVNIGIPESLHGTHVAGIAAANDLFGGAAFDGQAPGAQIVSARACSWGGGCTAAALTTGMVDLVTNRKVDVVNMSIGGLPPLNDANNARARLYDRLIRDYGVQLFISAGNSGPGLNTVGDPSVATEVVSVAASISKATWLSNYGSVVAKDNALFNFSSRGPREDGGFKPNLTAPGSAVSTINMWLDGDAVPEAGYQLPPGYGMANGTSMAAPQAAGGAALLLSAAKAKDLGVTPAALRRVLYSSARPIAGTSVAAQGNGLMNVPAAWALLAKGVQTRKYTSSAPVCSPLSDVLAKPGTGTGVYNRCAAGSGGLSAGQTKAYPVTLTRTSGPAGTVKHKLVWVGDTGSFRSAREVALPLNKPVKVTVTAAPKAGLNSAVLRVDDPATAVVDFEVLNTVVAAAAPAKPAYSVDVEGAVDRNSSRSYFVTVPAGATALQVNLSGIATGSQTRWIAINPWGVPVESTSSLSCYTNFSDAKACKPQSRSYENPMPGVWEIEVESRRTSPALSNPYELTARVQGVTVTPPALSLPSVTAGQPADVKWTVQNTFGPVTVTGKGGPLGSAATKRPTIADGARQEYTVQVPAGAGRLDVAIGGAADPSADLDLTVLLDGRQVAQQADGDAEEAVSIPNPAAGTYTVVVDGYAVPSGSTAYDYRDVYFSPSLGTLAVSSPATPLASGAKAAVAGTITATVAPPAGRTLFGELAVTSDEGAVLGRGTVTVTAVK